jgi:Uma2 family endonuclease
MKRARRRPARSLEWLSGRVALAGIAAAPPTVQHPASIVENSRRLGSGDAAPAGAIVAAVTAPKRRATYADLLEVPEHLVAEIIDGELVTSPRPALPHALAASALGSVLFDRFNRPPGGGDAPGGWWVLYEPELHFGEDVLVPDLAGWRRERVPVIPDAAAFALPPDWACEVISPSTARIDRARKMRVYGREGVANLWIVDPNARTLEVYRLEGGRWIVASTHAGGETVRAEPFAAVEIDMRRWWGEA